jgi:hypothetical protein
LISSGLSKRRSILRTATILVLVILSLPGPSTLTARSQTYGLKYDLSYSGIPFPGGVISVASNFTNTGQLTVRVTSVSLASDFWSNGTRQVTSGFPLNLTAGMNKKIDTSLLIPSSSSAGNHDLRATANWQYSNSSGWYIASPVAASITVMVSQTLDSLLANFTTILLIGLVITAVSVVLAIFVLTRRRRKSRSNPSSPVGPGPNRTALVPR